MSLVWQIRAYFHKANDLGGWGTGGEIWVGAGHINITRIDAGGSDGHR
jgi:hypothetical protein